MPGRYQGADVAAMVLSGLAALGALLPWGDASAGPFDHGQAIFALILAALVLLVFAVVPNPIGRKVTGIVLGLLILGACWMAIDDINRTTSFENAFGFFGDRGESMQAGLWMTFLASLGLVVASLIVRTRPREWGPVPAAAGVDVTMQSVHAKAPPGPAEAAGWTSLPPSGSVRTLRCPRCATTIAWYGTETPTCPKCGFQSNAVVRR